MRSLAAAAVAGVTLASDAMPSYEEWSASSLGARYPGNKNVYEQNLAKIAAHNADATQTWRMGVNQFAALTPEEFKKVYAGYTKPSLTSRAGRTFADLSNHVEIEKLPASLDWRTVSPSVVTPVKDQGGCGGCWAFSATETLESAIAIATGTLFVLSQQQILDCTPNPDDCGGTGGCSGATQELAFAYVNGTGITTNADYPWTGGSTFPTCNTGSITPVANITGYVTLPFNNYTALMNAVVNVGPIAISAAAEPWQLYSSGVFTGPDSTDVDHAIVLEGYGHDSSVDLDYYLVRNSWSTSWGEDGYIRVARYGSTSKGEPCGTDNTPGDGDGCNGGPASIKVCGLTGILSDSSYPTGAILA